MVAQSINTSYAVIVLGDHGTLEVDDLAVKAAEQGAVITESFSFEPGEPAGEDDLTEVESVVTALSRAIATRADIWVPFPIADFGREEHLRRLSLVLQRHGLNMLMGRDLAPCTTDGGFNPIDFALRTEVRAVDGLDFAAIAGAGVNTLGAEITFGAVELGKPFSLGESGWAKTLAEQSLSLAFGEKSVDIGIGGSIPFIAELERVFPSAQVLVTGVEDPDSRAHSPNESLHLEGFQSAILAQLLFLLGGNQITLS